MIQTLITDYYKPIKVYGYNEETEEWHCLECGISMGKHNPRQLCGKYCCDNIKTNFTSNDDLWEYLSNIYEDDILMLIQEFESYHEIKYGIGHVNMTDQKNYDNAKLKDVTGKLEKYGKQLLEFNKPLIDKNLRR